VFGSAFQVGISAWCLHKTGPLFVAMFKPVGIVISVFIGVIFLGDNFYLGRWGVYHSLCLFSVCYLLTDRAIEYHRSYLVSN